MNLIAVKYEGKKPYKDKTALRNLWQHGDTKSVPERDAKVLLRFAEFVRGDAGAADGSARTAVAAAVVAEQQQRQDEQVAQEGILTIIETMDKDALETYAAKYEVNLDKRRSVEKLRTEVANLVEQFGAR